MEQNAKDADDQEDSDADADGPDDDGFLDPDLAAQNGEVRFGDRDEYPEDEGHGDDEEKILLLHEGPADLDPDFAHGLLRPDVEQGHSHNDHDRGDQKGIDIRIGQHELRGEIALWNAESSHEEKRHDNNRDGKGREKRFPEFKEPVSSVSHGLLSSYGFLRNGLLWLPAAFSRGKSSFDCGSAA